MRQRQLQIRPDQRRHDPGRPDSRANWSETNRNVNGNLQGTAGGGSIDVFVEAAGFAANLNIRTNGNKQTVQISSKGEIRGVNITMTKS